MIDMSDHTDVDFWDEFKRVEEPIFVKPPKKVVSVRLDQQVADLLEMLAREKDIAYTTLVRPRLRSILALAGLAPPRHGATSRRRAPND